MPVEVWTKGSQRQYIKDGVEIVSYVGPEVNIANINPANGWTNTGPPPPYTQDVFFISQSHAENKYNALISVGMSDGDARRISGWNV